MLKIVICMKRRPEMSQAEFRRYWTEEHAKVVREVAGAMGMRRNVHNHTITTALDERIRIGRGAEMDDYDGVAESWFDSLEALIAATSTDEGAVPRDGSPRTKRGSSTFRGRASSLSRKTSSSNDRLISAKAASSTM